MVKYQTHSHHYDSENEKFFFFCLLLLVGAMTIFDYYKCSCRAFPTVWSVRSGGSEMLSVTTYTDIIINFFFTFFQQLPP